MIFAKLRSSGMVDPGKRGAMKGRRIGRVCLGLAALALAILGGGGAALAATGQSAPEVHGTVWAAWIDRDINLKLRHLPHNYSCDALWYKLRGILIALGASEYMAIRSYRCGYSPNLSLKFQVLRVVTGSQVGWANTKAAYKVVRLRPGHPEKLDANDCDLVSQLQETLVAALHLPVVASKLECADPSTAHEFYLSVRALVAQPSAAAPR